MTRLIAIAITMCLARPVLADDCECPKQKTATATERPSRVGPAVTMAVGVAALVTGGVLIAIDRGPTGDQPYYTETQPTGIAVGVGGAAVFGLGLAWWLHTGKESAPVVATSRHGAVVGWAWKF